MPVVKIKNHKPHNITVASRQLRGIKWHAVKVGKVKMRMYIQINCAQMEKENISFFNVKCGPLTRCATSNFTPRASTKHLFYPTLPGTLLSSGHPTRAAHAFALFIIHGLPVSGYLAFCVSRGLQSQQKMLRSHSGLEDVLSISFTAAS